MVELPPYRWWTDGYYLPVEIEVLGYRGAGTWVIRFPSGGVQDVDEEALYTDLLEATYKFLETTVGLALAATKLRHLAEKRGQSVDVTIGELLAERAIANSMLDKGR